jgi:hypothetical protein
MSQLDEKALVALGRETADKFVGPEGATAVEVYVGQDSVDQEAYFFSFLIDWNNKYQSLGELHIQLAQSLRDQLIARHDEHYPVVEIISPTDWRKRKVA